MLIIWVKSIKRGGMKKEFIGPGLQLRPVHADQAQPPFQWTLNSVFAKSLQSCPTLCDPRDGSPPGSPVPGILQARTLEWVAISFSNAWNWKVKVKSLSRVWLFETPWTAAYQAPPSMGFSRQPYWSGVPLPSPNSVFSAHEHNSRRIRPLHTGEPWRSDLGYSSPKRKHTLITPSSRQAINFSVSIGV